MIRIEKSAATPKLPVYTTERDGPNGPETRAASELGLAIGFFTDKNNYANNKKLNKKSFGFKVYKDKGIARELDRIFDGKCAYCESRFAHVMPKDVEHFRPKSEVENPGQPAVIPGYFWLAGDWTNLLVSCLDCNRARKHTVPGQPKGVSLGKHSQFPLSNEARRVRLHTADVASEEQHRLLLNPCIDYPENHLTYDDDGLVKPTVAGDAKAEMSIIVYALQRKALVENRKRLLNDLTLKLQLLKSLAVELNAMDGNTPAATRSAKLGQIKLQMDGICLMFADGQQYLGLLRDNVRRNLATGAFADITQAGFNLQLLLP